jgi:hypothetical protein
VKTCPNCGGTRISWAFKVDIAAPGGKRRRRSASGFAYPVGGAGSNGSPPDRKVRREVRGPVEDHPRRIPAQWLSAGDWEPNTRCPRCSGCSGCVQRWHGYWRHLRGESDRLIWIRRVRCVVCGVTQSLLPWFVLPWRTPLALAFLGAGSGPPCSAGAGVLAEPTQGHDPGVEDGDVPLVGAQPQFRRATAPGEPHRVRAGIDPVLAAVHEQDGRGLNPPRGARRSWPAWPRRPAGVGGRPRCRGRAPTRPGPPRRRAANGGRRA